MTTVFFSLTFLEQNYKVLTFRYPERRKKIEKLPIQCCAHHGRLAVAAAPPEILRIVQVLFEDINGVDTVFPLLKTEDKSIFKGN